MALGKERACTEGAQALPAALPDGSAGRSRTGAPQRFVITIVSFCVMPL